MDAHNADAARPGSAGDHQPPLLHSVQVIQEGRKPPVGAAFKVASVLEEGLQVLCPYLAPRHGGEKAVQTGLRQGFFQQSRQSAVPCLPAKDVQHPQEFRRLWLLTVKQRVIKAPLGFPRPNFCQVVGGKAEYRACQNAQKRNVLPGILDGLQKASQGLHLTGLEQIRSGSRGAANAPAFQCPLEITGGTARRAQQDHDILRPNRPQALLIPHQGSGFQHFLNPPGGKGRLLGVGVGNRLQGIQLHPRIGKPPMGHPLPEGFRFSVVETAHLWGHAGGEHLVHPLDDLGTGAEVVAEQHLPTFPRLGLLRANIFIVLFQENPWVCQSELINGLLHVAD